MNKATLIDAKRIIPDDPVRPELDAYFRVSKNREMFYTETVDKLHAVICVAYCNVIPKTVQELEDAKQGDIAVFYSVWSYGNGPRGSGRKIVLDLWKDLEERDDYKRYVTMSPKTSMAKRFHLRNGAILLSENEETNNFEYETGPGPV